MKTVISSTSLLFLFTLLFGALTGVESQPSISVTAVATEVISQVELLQEALQPQDCASPCFMGIEFGVMTKDELDASFADLGITPEVVDYFGTGTYSYFFYIPHTFTPFLTSDVSPSRAGIDITDGVVHQMSFNVDLSIDTVLKAFGHPDTVRQSIGQGVDTFYITYLDERLIFHVISGEAIDTPFVNSIMIVSNLYPMNFLDAPIGMPHVEETCVVYGVPPCIAPTIVPKLTFTPSITPMPSLTPTPQPTINLTPPTITPSFTWSP
jgi:hypothetical protein